MMTSASAAAVAVTESGKQLYSAAIEAAIKWPGPSAALFAAAVGGSLFAVVSCSCKSDFYTDK